tara:strand:+ start:760 stop:1290 length:531 start_codon:yes stop_codon:yes gene_type:complete
MVVRRYRVLPDELCDALIELFENDSKHHERVDYQFKPTFTQLNLNQHHGKIIPTLLEYVLEVIEQYKNDVPTATYLPNPQFFEEFRVKRYNVGGLDRFDEHVDVSDHETARRCLAMLFYLNSVPVGGHTTFPHQGESFRATEGYVTVFPPTWEYPHTGEAPISNTKYIMSTYLHYG